MELTTKMTEKLDAIYEAADQLLKELNPEYEHDMESCGELVEVAQNILLAKRMAICYPYIAEDKNEPEIMCCDDKTSDGVLRCGNKTCLCE